MPLVALAASLRLGGPGKGFRLAGGVASQLLRTGRGQGMSAAGSLAWNAPPASVIVYGRRLPSVPGATTATIAPTAGPPLGPKTVPLTSAGAGADCTGRRDGWGVALRWRRLDRGECRSQSGGCRDEDTKTASRKAQSHRDGSVAWSTRRVAGDARE